MGADMEASIIGSLILIFAQLHQPAAALDDYSQGICDGRSLQQNLNLHRNAPSRPKNDFPTPELIRSNGYPAEEHWTTTPDGYILALHRIPHGLTNKDLEGPRPAILVQHGLLCSSADWVVSTPSKGLGYIPADAGYDVWLGNYRGNTYSRNHTFLNPDALFNHKFWDFTWDEMAKYDIPSMVEKVLEVTGEEEIFYAGHSMGTTAFMAMGHYRPDILDKIRLANLLAPVTSETNMGGPLGWIAEAGGIIDDILTLMGVGEFLPSNWLVDCLSSLFCHEGDLTQGICTSILFVLCGYDATQLNNTLLPDILHHTPAGASTHTILHYAQEKTNPGFHAFDWGSDRLNVQHHQSTEPPVYDLNKVTAPVALYWSDNDYFAEPGDILFTMTGLPNVVPGMNHEVGWKAWSHLDFLWGIDADRFVFSYLLNNLQFCKENDCRNL